MDAKFKAHWVSNPRMLKIVGFEQNLNATQISIIKSKKIQQGMKTIWALGIIGEI